VAADGKEKLTRRAHYVHVCTTFEWVCNLHCSEVGRVAAITLFTLELQREAAQHTFMLCRFTNYCTTLLCSLLQFHSSCYVHLNYWVETKALWYSDERAHFLEFHTAFFVFQLKFRVCEFLIVCPRESKIE